MDADAVVTPPHVARPLRLTPFRALRLAPGRIGGRGSIRAFARPYQQVAERFQRWESAGQVSYDDEAAIYLHEYTATGVTVRGLVGGLDISRAAHRIDDAAVLPHEGIHPAQVAEIAERMTEMRMNPAPILLVHHGSEQLRERLTEVSGTPPTHQFTDRSGQYHRIWAIRETATLAAVAAELAGRRALVADGHHRYAAYLRMRADRPSDRSLDSGLAMLVDQRDTPLYVGAIHRVLAGVALADLRRLPGFRSLPNAGPAQAIDALGPHMLITTDGRDWAALHLPITGDRLAVEVLHDDLLPALPRPPVSVDYAHSVDEALQAVARRRGLAVLMPAPEFDQVLQTASTGSLLPEKATSFQPKPSVGPLIRSLRDG